MKMKTQASSVEATSLAENGGRGRVKNGFTAEKMRTFSTT